MTSTLYNTLASLGAYTSLIGEVTLLSFTRPPAWRLIRDQLFHIGVMSFGVIAITGLSTGLVLATQAFYQLSDKGMTSVTGIMVGKAMITELGPVLTAFMVTGRVGASMCAELGTMKVTEQIDALKSMGVDPNRYLISPRFLASTLMVPVLTIFCVVMGIIGGYLISVYFFNMVPSTFLDPLWESITNVDLLTCFVKAFIFGILIASIACYKGMHVKGGAQGVGLSTTNSVVISYSAILISNFLMTLAITRYGYLIV